MKTAQILIARLHRDGRRVCCGAMQPKDPTRPGCGGELGQLVWKRDEDDVLGINSGIGDFWRFHRADGPLFEIASGFGFQWENKPCLPPEGFFRETERPMERTDRHLWAKMPDDSEPPNPWFTSHDQSGVKDWSGNAGQRLFGEERNGDGFALPIKVRCPRCKRLNLATIALLEGAPPQQ